MTTAEIEEKITGIFEEAIRQKTVNGVSYALVDQGGVSRHYLGQAEPVLDQGGGDGQRDF